MLNKKLVEAGLFSLTTAKIKPYIYIFKSLEININ